MKIDLTSNPQRSGQMPIDIFLIMSIGLGVGYIAGGQVLHALLG
jgi:hypothetical protein